MWDYVGGPGQFIAGVPARDLSDDEAEEHGVKGSPLYQPVAEQAAPAAIAPTDGKE